MPAFFQEKDHTIEDVYALPDGERAELVGGQMYMMAPPSRMHQAIAREIFASIHSHIKSRGGACEAYFAPFAVFLGEGGLDYVEPDVCVICDRKKLTDRGCLGAPDWVIEIVSPGSRRMDYYTKLFLYRASGVLEYWIADPDRGRVTVYDFESEDSREYSFADSVPSSTLKGLSIDFSSMAKLR